MEFRDLKKQYQVLKSEMDAAIENVLMGAHFISGPQVKELEQQLAEYVGVKHCITCGNGTDALTLMMMAWKIGPGDAVFVPDFTFFASGEVVSFEGGTPVFVDVEEETFNMDADALERAICAVEKEGKLKPKAVVAVDLFGLPADFAKIEQVAKKHGLLVLEDGAQGFGGSIEGKKACSFGDAGTTSFFPAKPLGCYGDGGAVFTNDDETEQYLRSVCVHGKGAFKYDNVRIGMNTRLDTVQAAILLVKLKAFCDHELVDVNRAAAWYDAALPVQLKKPVIPAGFGSSWAQYTLRMQDEQQRERVQAALKEKGIPTMVYYPKPMHLQKAFEGKGLYEPCPVTERLCKTVLSLPMHPYLTQEQVQQVSEQLALLL